MKLTHHIRLKEGIKCTHFGMKTYLTIQESGGEGDKQGGRDNGREGRRRREQFKVNTLGEGQDQKTEQKQWGAG